MAAIMRTAKQSADVLGTLKLHIGMGLKNDSGEDNSLDIQIRIAEIDAQFKAMLGRFLIHVYHRRYDIFFPYPPD